MPAVSHIPPHEVTAAQTWAPPSTAAAAGSQTVEDSRILNNLPRNIRNDAEPPSRMDTCVYMIPLHGQPATTSDPRHITRSFDGDEGAGILVRRKWWKNVLKGIRTGLDLLPIRREVEEEGAPNLSSFVRITNPHSRRSSDGSMPPPHSHHAKQSVLVILAPCPDSATGLKQNEEPISLHHFRTSQSASKHNADLIQQGPMDARPQDDTHVLQARNLLNDASWVLMGGNMIGSLLKKGKLF